MEPARSIARLGFRKWYERQLIDSHLSFVTCFLSMLMVAIFMEDAKSAADDWAWLMRFGMVISFVALALISWRRYQRVLGLAERYAEHATCAHCQAYGRLSVTNSGCRQDDPSDDSTRHVWLNVTCKRCGHAWRMTD